MGLVEWKPADAGDGYIAQELEVLYNDAFGPYALPLAGDYPAALSEAHEAFRATLTEDAAENAYEDVVESIVALGWVTIRDETAHLRGYVHPAHTDVERDLIAIGEDIARETRAHLMTIHNEANTPRTDTLYHDAGFNLYFAENIMCHDLTGSPVLKFPAHARVIPWTDADGPLFYAVFVEAFRERLQDNPPREPDWISTMVDDADFRPDYSALVLMDDHPAGYVVCHVNVNRGHGWITQMGVDPQFRGRGIASALLARTTALFAADGDIVCALLHVNVNNAQAESVYRRSGFRIAGQRARYMKTL